MAGGARATRAETMTTSRLSAANLASATGFWSRLVLDLDEEQAVVVSSQHASAKFNRLEHWLSKNPL